MAEYKTYLDPQNECYGCNGIRCGSCLDYDCHDTDKHPLYENDYEKGNLKRKKQTNADRIRSMSDEQLVEHWPCPYDTAGSNIMPCMLDDNVMGLPDEAYCRKCMMDWLKKEVSD